MPNGTKYINIFKFFTIRRGCEIGFQRDWFNFEVIENKCYVAIYI